MSSFGDSIRSRFSRARGRLPSVVDRFDLRISEDDAASVRTLLPAYSRNSSQSNRPPSPTPTYYTIDEQHGTPTGKDGPPPDKTKVDPQPVIDEFVTRVGKSINNPDSWRVKNNGEKSFFWALRCVPGTADILHQHVEQIQQALVGDHDWKVEKFCFIFRAQKFVDLWCRPIDIQVLIHNFSF
jgi:hypothetical protein